MKTNVKCTDLRIGNWVYVPSFKYYNDEEDGFGKVKSINQDSIDVYPFKKLRYDKIEPIELTEEVLVKIGFEKDGNNYSLVCGDIEVGYYIDKFKQVLYINVCREKRFYKNELRSYDVKYLHQLQNAYYCLTGQELEVEL